jgi:hypothetical protein
MVIQDRRRNVQAGNDRVSVVSPYSDVRSVALSLERRFRSQGLTVAEARKQIARRVRIGIGTFENIVRDRVKRIDWQIRDRLQALLVRELEAEIARLSNELDLARQSGCHPASQHVTQVESFLRQARALLETSA